jgi:hypothetical protein
MFARLVVISGTPLDFLRIVVDNGNDRRARLALREAVILVLYRAPLSLKKGRHKSRISRQTLECMRQCVDQRLG